jgi:predicted nucleic-acid-binding protein
MSISLEMDYLLILKKNMANNKKIAGSLDANILLRFVLGDVPEQVKHIDGLFKKGQIFDVADVAIVEFVFVLEKVYGFTRGNVVENLIAIISHTQINSNQDLFLKTIQVYTLHSKLSFMDCVLLSSARLNETCPLYTFDKALITNSNNDAIAPKYD